MFNKNKELVQRIEELERKIDKWFCNTRNIQEIEKRLEQLECPHENTEFISKKFFERKVFIERCMDCGKTVTIFDNEIDYQKAKLKANQGCLENIKARINRLEAGKERTNEFK